MAGEHYYTPAPTSRHDPGEVVLRTRGLRLTLATDAGVFAKSGVDRGTRLLIEALAIPEGARRLVDLGCGYGPIGLAMAAMAPKAQVFLIDPNERACALARANAIKNGLPNAVVLQGAGLAPVAGGIDLVVTNPPIRAGKEVVYGLMAEAAGRLEPSGELWVVARTSQGALSLERELARLFRQVDEVEKGGGFRVYRAVSAMPK